MTMDGLESDPTRVSLPRTEMISKKEQVTASCEELRRVLPR